ncbi:MAG: gliding motility-associated C-terminal domain-containing protein, partial [Bacteroidia bacterium]|nr:gliding motility-associated C-terminal domain-containing protein [Bacteroidia bacterium]
SVTASSQAVVSINSFVNNTCFGTSEGTATATLTGGVAPFVYLWSNGDTTFTADSLAAGSYTIQVTDSNNCISTGNITISEPNAFNFTYAVNNAFCNGANNGSATVTVTGGTGSYQFNWSNGDTGIFADSLPGGYVSVQVTDSVGCTLIDSVNIVQGTSINSTIAASSDVTCFGGNNGSASVNSATGGIGPLTYTWSNGDTGLSTNNLIAGVYTMNIVDSVNCSLALTITINEPPQLTLNLAATNVTCFGDNNGIADAQVAGGTGTYSYAWTPNISSDSILVNLSPGTYSVVITDQNLCTTNSTATIVEPNEIVSDAGLNISDCEESFILNASLNSPYNGQWSVVTGSANFSDVTSPTTTVSGLTLGNNVLLWTITDGSCFGTDSLIVRRNTDAECELDIPTGITPNDDGKNDQLVIHGIERYPDNVLTIYNRWGNLVYQKENYANEWVGQNNSNEFLPEGTYFIVLVIRNTTIQMTSYIDLRRQ